jgi:hypothetical protein
MGAALDTRLVAIEAAIGDTLEIEPAFTDARDRREALLGLARLETQLAGLKLRLLAACDDVALAEGSRDVAALVTHHLRTDAGSDQRKAMILRDRQCRAEGCTVPAGRTDLKDGLLLCSWHHHRVHDDTYDVTRMPSGDVRFSRRT